MKTLIVLAFCFTACLAHGSWNNGGNRGGGNLIDIPFTVETRTISGGNTRGNSGRSNNNFNTQPQYQRPQVYQRTSVPMTSGVSTVSRARTQYIDIPFTVETVRSQNSRPQAIARPQIRQQPQIQMVRQQRQFQPQPQFRQQQQFQPQFRQQQQPQIIRQQQPQYTSPPRPEIRQPSFQIERSYPVATFDLPATGGGRSFDNNNNRGISNTRSESHLIDYPFTVEVSRSSGSSGRNTGSGW